MGTRFSTPVQTGPGAHIASCIMGTGSFPGVKGGRGMILTPHPLLVPWSRKGTAIPLLPLWAVRPVQSLSACTRAHFTLLLPKGSVKKIYMSPGRSFSLGLYQPVLRLALLQQIEPFRYLKTPVTNVIKYLERLYRDLS